MHIKERIDAMTEALRDAQLSLEGIVPVHLTEPESDQNKEVQRRMLRIHADRALEKIATALNAAYGLPTD